MAAPPSETAAKGRVVLVVNPKGAEPVLYVRLAGPSPFRQGQAVTVAAGDPKP